MKGTQIEQIIAAYPVPTLKPSDMQGTISKAKQILLEDTKYSHAKGFFIYNQMKSISLFFWLIQFLCFAYVAWSIAKIENIEHIRTLFAVIVPVLALYILPELHKAHINNLIELESACAHSPAKIVGSKLMILSISNYIVITLISLAFGIFHKLNLMTVLAQGLIPFNIAISISLVVFDFVKLKSPYAMFGATILIAASLTLLPSRAGVIFEHWRVALPASFVALSVLTALTLYRISKVKEWYYGT